MLNKELTFRPWDGLPSSHIRLFPKSNAHTIDTSRVCGNGVNPTYLILQRPCKILSRCKLYCCVHTGESPLGCSSLRHPRGLFVLDRFSKLLGSAHSTVRLRQQPTPAGLEFLNLSGESELDAEGSGLRTKIINWCFQPIYSGANFSKCPQDV